MLYSVTINKSIHIHIYYIIIVKASFSVCYILFLKYSNKSHNMKAVIIRSHSWSPFFLLTHLYVRPFGIFSWEIIPPVSRELLCTYNTFTKLSLSNIMIHGESDVERQISIQGMHLSDFNNYFWKEKEALIVELTVYWTILCLYL